MYVHCIYTRWKTEIVAPLSWGDRMISIVFAVIASSVRPTFVLSNPIVQTHDTMITCIHVYVQVRSG
jgi:hypothetical protein